MSDILIPAGTLKSGTTVQLDGRLGFKPVNQIGWVVIEGIRYTPEVQPRATLPSAEIFDHIPALAAEITEGGDRRVVEFWRDGDRIESSEPGRIGQHTNERWNDWADWTKAQSISIPCVPCERGNIFATIPWPEGF